MKIYYTYEGMNYSISGDKYITQSEYDKATVTYKKEFSTPVVEETYVEKTDVDVDGNTIILGKTLIKVPVMEEVKEGRVPKVITEIKEVRYNPYDEQGVVIIPDDSEVISEEEYHKIIEEMNNRFNKPKETSEEKKQDLKEAQEIILSGQYIVNISSKGKKKIATIFDSKTANADGVEFDTERGDINTDSLEIAEKYKTIVESEGLNIAMERYKSL